MGDPTGPQPQLKHACANFKPKKKATICDSRLRTYNTQAEGGSDADFYQYSPWRAPGSAPVIDACGSAGGRHPGQGTGGAGASFQNSSPNRPQKDPTTIGLLPNLEIVDVVKIPVDLKPGKYVLGWRYDCEETDQIWSSCSDITVTAADVKDVIV